MSSRRDGFGGSLAGRSHRQVGRKPHTALIWASIVLIVAACSTSVPFDYPKVASTAIPPGDTGLARDLAERSAGMGEMSGFYPLDDGTDALGARLRLIERAEQSIDVQYFYVKDDIAGTLVAAKLLRAADRGVRVRILIDDIVAFSSIDEQMALMDHHPNIEIRLFNPIPRGGLVGLNFVVSFQRANRRMHNKSFTVDNTVTIVGGRNIGDAYFRLSEGEFIDFDLLGFGSVAVEVSESFDLFWNDDLAVPVAAFGSSPDDEAYAQERRMMEAFLESDQAEIYQEAINTPFIQDLKNGRIDPIFSSHAVVTDSPLKIQGGLEGERDALAVEFLRVLDEAREEVIILTPYLVPGRDGLAFLSSLVDKGTRVVLITNSLASTDHIAVHSGYVTYRQRLIEAGVEIHELKVDALTVAQPDAPYSSHRVALHTKAAIIDREILFVGSLNLDPRSFDINSEMGIFLYSPQAAGAFAEQLEAALPVYTYRVEVDEEGELLWIYEGGTKPVTKTSEPDASIARAFGSDFLGILPLEKQL